MNYLQSIEQWLDAGYFYIFQIRAWKNDINRSALFRWARHKQEPLSRGSNYLIAKPKKAIYEDLSKKIGQYE